MLWFVDTVSPTCLPVQIFTYLPPLPQGLTGAPSKPDAPGTPICPYNQRKRRISSQVAGRDKWDLHVYILWASDYNVKVTVQFETEGNGQNEFVSHMDRSEVKL